MKLGAFDTKHLYLVGECGKSGLKQDATGETSSATAAR